MPKKKLMATPADTLDVSDEDALEDAPVKTLRQRQPSAPVELAPAPPPPAPAAATPTVLPPAALVAPAALPVAVPPAAPSPAPCSCSMAATEFHKHNAELEETKKILTKHSEYFETLAKTMVTTDKLDSMLANFKSYTEGLTRAGQAFMQQPQFIPQEQYMRNNRNNTYMQLPFSM